MKFIFSDNGIVYCFWHFSIWHEQDARASVGETKVDLNIFRGDRHDLKQFVIQ